MLIESNTEWTLNQSNEFKVMNSLSTPRPKTKGEYCWYFVPCINIKEDEDTYAFNRMLVHHGAKIKWEARRTGWCWFPSLNVYEMTLVFFPLVLNHFSVEWKLFSKVFDPLMSWEITSEAVNLDFGITILQSSNKDTIHMYGHWCMPFCWFVCINLR
jgi:hypothetical protein